LNHVTGDSGIPRESPNRRVGIKFDYRILGLVETEFSKLNFRAELHHLGCGN
jgi:hypothetical protein